MEHLLLRANIDFPKIILIVELKMVNIEMLYLSNSY